ncbi:MAG TPA: hypothetical protein VII66_01095 [Gemmatimonadaceae bacterium]
MTQGSTFSTLGGDSDTQSEPEEKTLWSTWRSIASQINLQYGANIRTPDDLMAYVETLAAAREQLDSIPAQMASAVAAEREGCEALANQMALYTGVDVADAIRARGEPSTPNQSEQ